MTKKEYKTTGAKISVITPTYNRSDLLVDAIKSVQAQSYDNWEMLVVGDHCTDDTEKVVTQFNDPRVKFFNLEKHAGGYGGASRNFGISVAEGDWLAYLDDDNRYKPGHLSAMYTTAMEKEALLVYCSTELRSWFDPQYHVVRSSPAPRLARVDTSEIMHHKSVSETWDYLAYTQDWKYFNTLLRKGVKWAHSNDVTLIYYKKTPYLFTNEIMLFITGFDPAKHFNTLLKIKKERPDFRATLGIPLSKMNKDHCNYFSTLDWIETVPNGISGKAGEVGQWKKTDYAEIQEDYLLYTTRGFHSPGWKVNAALYKFLKSHNWWILDNPKNERSPGVRAFYHVWDVRHVVFPEIKRGMIGAYCTGDSLNSELTERLINAPTDYLYGFISEFI